VAQDHLGVAGAEAALAVAHDPGEPVIGLERVTARGDEIDDLLEILPG
jgi:hypothetical protein